MVNTVVKGKKGVDEEKKVVGEMYELWKKKRTREYMRGQKVEDFEIFGEVFVKFKDWERFFFFCHYFLFLFCLVLFYFVFSVLFFIYNQFITFFLILYFRYFSLISCYLDLKSHQQITKIVERLKKEPSSLETFLVNLFATLKRIFTTLSPLDNYEIPSLRCLFSFLFPLSPSSCFKLINEVTEKMEHVMLASRVTPPRKTRFLNWVIYVQKWVYYEMGKKGIVGPGGNAEADGGFFSGGVLGACLRRLKVKVSLVKAMNQSVELNRREAPKAVQIEKRMVYRCKWCGSEHEMHYDRGTLSC